MEFLKGVALATVMDMPVCGGLCTHMVLLQRMLIKHGVYAEWADGRVDKRRFRQAMLALKALCTCQEPRAAWIQRRPDFIREKLKKLRFSFDLIHAHDPLAAVASFDLGFPVVTTIHGPMSRHAKEHSNLSGRYISVLREYEKKCYQKTSHFIAVDTGQKDILIEEGVAKNRIDVIPNAVDVDALRSAASVENKIVYGDYFVLPRRLVPKNGPQVAVDAFLSWVGNKNVNLVIAGDGHLRGQLERLTQEHANGRKVIFLGMLPSREIPPLLSGAIAAFIPSVPYEGVIEATSIAALEALALDVPVIASNIGGLTEIDGGSGIMSLVPPNDKAALAKQFEYWFERRREERGVMRSSYVQEHFGAEQWLLRILEVYKKVLDGTKNQ